MGSQVIEPPKLSAGDTIGIIAPATPFTPAVPPAFQAQFARGVAHFETRMFDKLFSQHTAGYDFPILSQVDLGHTDPKRTLPIGIRESLDSASGLFSFAEAPVRAHPS